VRILPLAGDDRVGDFDGADRDQLS
jgi:hypothetical protein